MKIHLKEDAIITLDGIEYEVREINTHSYFLEKVRAWIYLKPCSEKDELLYKLGRYNHAEFFFWSVTNKQLTLEKGMQFEVVNILTSYFNGQSHHPGGVLTLYADLRML